MTAISRIMYCPNCYNEGYPRTGELFILWGSRRRYFFIQEAQRKGVRGFTPHILTYIGLDEKGLAKIEVTCGMNGCGVNISQSKTGYNFAIKSKRFMRLPVPDWNCLQFLKDDPQFEI